MSASIRRVVQKVNSQAGITGYKVQTHSLFTRVGRQVGRVGQWGENDWKLIPTRPIFTWGELVYRWGELVTGAKWQWGELTVNPTHKLSTEG